MSLISAALLGFLQGISEFLPISSSGHLVIAQNIIPSINQPGVLFEVVLHAGTLLAIVVYFRKAIASLKKKYLYMLCVGTIPAVVIGLLFHSAIEGLFLNIRLVGFALIITGLINYLTDKLKTKKQVAGYKFFRPLMVGFAQAFAIIPGISRSGSTIFAATKLGMKRKEAAQFSFLLSIPAIIGANLLQFAKYVPNGQLDFSLYLVGFTSAFVAGLISINFVIKLLLTKRFRLFAVYCILLGLFVLII